MGIKGIGGEGNHRLPDPLQHRRSIMQHLIVPEPQYDKALTAQPCIPADIVSFLLSMLASIDLHYQPWSHADKVNDI